MLQSLQKITNAKLFVVGDDWQSIYKFNGSDLNLFIDFDKYFSNSEFINLQENRRNYDRLNRISSDFIMKNEKQEKKKLISKKRNNPNPINIVYYSLNPKSNKVLKLYSIILNIAKRNPKSRILLLGRNNNDINEFTNKNNIFESYDYTDKITCLQNRKLNIRFMTIHSAKGLEYDDVIILNFKDKLNGFPAVSYLINQGKTPEDILTMIFDDVTILDSQDLFFECDCSKERMKEALMTVGAKEIQDIIDEDHGCEMTCHFCNTHYSFNEEELKELLEEIK